MQAEGMRHLRARLHAQHQQRQVLLGRVQEGGCQEVPA